MSLKEILVAGGAEYIGSHLVRQAVNGQNIKKTTIKAPISILTG